MWAWASQYYHWCLVCIIFYLSLSLFSLVFWIFFAFNPKSITTNVSTDFSCCYGCLIYHFNKMLLLFRHWRNLLLLPVLKFDPWRLYIVEWYAWNIQPSHGNHPVFLLIIVLLSKTYVGLVHLMSSFLYWSGGQGRNADALALYFGEDPARCPFEQGNILICSIPICHHHHRRHCCHPHHHHLFRINPYTYSTFSFFFLNRIFYWYI